MIIKGQDNRCSRQICEIVIENNPFLMLVEVRVKTRSKWLNHLLLIDNTDTFSTANLLLTAVSDRESNNSDRRGNSLIFRNETSPTGCNWSATKSNPMQCMYIWCYSVGLSLGCRPKSECYNSRKLLSWLKLFFNFVTIRLYKIRRQRHTPWVHIPGNRHHREPVKVITHLHPGTKFHKWLILLIVFTGERGPRTTKKPLRMSERKAAGNSEAAMNITISTSTMASTPSFPSYTTENAPSQSAARGLGSRSFLQRRNEFKILF